MIIRLALVKPEAVILQPRDGHPGAVRRLDPHGRILHHKALVLPDSENIRRVVIDLRVWFALLELFSADDEVKFRRMPTSSTILEISFGPVDDTSATIYPLRFNSCTVVFISGRKIFR